MSAPFAVYVHVPWCRHVCPYCDFNVYASARPPEESYVDALIVELTTYAARAPWAGRTAATVYLGGGTPSLFAPAAIGRLLEAIAGRVGLAAGAEVTLEANPRTLTRGRLGGYRTAGVNRLSLGAQTFDAGRLRTLGRDHTPEDIPAAVEAARAAGIDNVSLDLISGVPGSTLADWEHDLSAAIGLAPAHVSAYALTYESGTPFHAWRGAGRIVAVDEEAEAEMAEATGALLGAAGYERYEISSWARAGRESRHNLAYWSGDDYLALGAGAHGFSRLPAPGRRWVNERRPDRWAAAVAAGGVGVATSEPLDVATARADFMVAGLRRTAGVVLSAFEERFGVPLDVAFPHVTGLIADGMMERAGPRIRLTPRGLLLADTVAATFV